jgi:hypothetical protein
MGQRCKIGVGWLVVAMTVTSLGCNGDDRDRLARMGRTIAAKTEELTSGANDQLAGGWDAVRADLDKMALDARVSARLRWDKALAGAAIQVHSEGGTVELTGQVADAAQRSRAVDLAESTMGAEKVVDKLDVPAPTP